MRKITIEGKEYPISATGLSVVIYEDAFHEDFMDAAFNLFVAAGKENVPLGILSKIAWTLIRTANEELLPAYREFMTATKAIGGLGHAENFTAILSEVAECLDVGKVSESETTESETKKKKKKTEKVDLLDVN